MAAAVLNATSSPAYCPGSDTDPAGLRFGTDGQFKITVFGDLHFGEGSSVLLAPIPHTLSCKSLLLHSIDAWPDCGEYDSKSIKVMNDILEWEATDLAVLNGDLVTGEAITRGDHARHIGKEFTYAYLSRTLTSIRQSR
jgi:hypothetical protein